MSLWPHSGSQYHAFSRETALRAAPPRSGRDPNDTFTGKPAGARLAYQPATKLADFEDLVHQGSFSATGL